MRIAIIGLGLIGGSIGLALKRANDRQYEITGYARKKQTSETALSLGAIDVAASSCQKAVEHANVVLVATPVLALHDIFIEIAPHLPVGCIITDAASTKAEVMRWAEELLPAHVNFIGGHPMAGKEKSGIESADASLFYGCTYCLVHKPQTADFAVRTIVNIAHDCGASVLHIDAERHDLFTAGISHLPFIMSAGLCGVTTRHPQWKDISQLASTGYRDMTRLAAGNPDMYRDICFTNKANISYWLDLYIEELRRLQHYIDTGNPELGGIFTHARDMREEWWQNRK